MGTGPAGGGAGAATVGAVVVVVAWALAAALGAVVVGAFGAAVVAVVAAGAAVVTVVDGAVVVVGASDGLTATTMLGSGTSVSTAETSDDVPPCPPMRSSTSSGRHSSVTARAITRRRCVGCRKEFRAASLLSATRSWRGRRAAEITREGAPVVPTPPGAVPAT